MDTKMAWAWPHTEQRRRLQGAIPLLGFGGVRHGLSGPAGPEARASGAAAYWACAVWAREGWRKAGWALGPLVNWARRSSCELGLAHGRWTRGK